MKRIISLILVLFMVVMLVACSNNPPQPPENSDASDSTTNTIVETTEVTTEVTTEATTEATTTEPPIIIEDPVILGDMERTGIDLSKYTMFDWEPTANQYYDSRKKSSLGGIPSTTGKTVGTFVSSAKTYGKDVLPSGTVFVIDDGWSFIFDCWYDEETVNDMYTRMATVNGSYWVIGENFWSSFIYGGIDVFKNNSEDLSDKFEEASNALRIYIPNEEIQYKEPLKVLAIGNSFSVDAMQYLVEIANSVADQPLILGNMYIGGCTLATHATNFANNSNSYVFYKNEGSVWSPSTTLTSLPKTNAKAVLTSMDWDIITIQQASGYSGLSGTYNDDINTIINVVKTYCPNAKIYWHMTWAYQSNSGHADFAKYDKDRTKMYNGIIDAVQNKILTNDSFSGVIPVGTMIENLRGLVGDNITRDGYHLKYEEGRFAAGMCWYAYLTGKDVADIKFRPTASITPEFLESIKIAVSHAIEKPFEVTDK